MLRGGAGFINLNGEYYHGHESGGQDTQTVIVPQKKILRDFLESFDFSKMVRFTGIEGIPAGAFAGALAEHGKQYGVYLFHTKYEDKWGAHFVAIPGSYRDSFALKAIPPAPYEMEWIDPVTGQVTGKDKINWGGGDPKITTPAYRIDVALRMRRR